MLALVHIGSPTLVGQYGIALAIGAPVMAFANLQLRGLQATDAKRQFDFGDYFGLRVISTSVAMVMIVVLAVRSGQSNTVTLAAIFLGLRAGVLSISDVFYGFFQQHERLDKVAQATIWSNGVNWLAFVVGLVATEDLVIAVACATLAALIPLAVHNLPTARAIVSATGRQMSLRPRWDIARLRPLFKQALPLAIVSFLISLNANIPRYFFAGSVGLDDLGIFVALLSFLIASDTMGQAVAQTISPRLARLYAANDRRAFVSLLGRVEMIAATATIVGIGAAGLLGPEVVSLVYEAQYAQEPAAIVWLAIAAGFGLMGRFVANAITAARRLNIQVLNNIVGVLVLTVACVLLIPNFGVVGGMAAVAASAISRFLLNSLVCFKFLQDWPAQAPTLSH
jgi:O-antigen/teichoic acid export membrane protein